MTYLTLQQRIADNLGMLADDGTTIRNGRVTLAGIKNAINDVYLETLFPKLADKFSTSFRQFTYPLPTYTATGTVSASSTGTTLVASTSMFTNDMEGFRVYNATDSVSAVIATYTNATTVTLDTTIGDTWDGDTIYVLGNEFSFGGSMTDTAQLLGVWVKYSSTDTDFVPCERLEGGVNAMVKPSIYSKTAPKWYPTTLDVGGVPTNGVGILPFPDSYQGKIQLIGVEQPPALVNDGDQPVNIPGLGQVIINGVTAWGFRMQGLFDQASVYEEKDVRNPEDIYPRGTLALVKTYKPMSRSGNKRINLSPRVSARINGLL